MILNKKLVIKLAKKNELKKIQNFLKLNYKKKHILSQNTIVRGAAERNAINAPIQGSAADIIKIAMIKIHNRMEAGDWKAKMLLQVHDELVFDVPKTEVESLSAMVKEEMENAFSLDVPLVVDLGVGNNWLEAH